MTFCFRNERAAGRGARGENRFYRAEQRAAFCFCRVRKKSGEKKGGEKVSRSCMRARDARLDTCNFGQAKRARTRVYAPCTLFTIMRSLHRPGSRRSSNSERQGQTQPYMDGWTNTSYAFVLARSFVRSFVRSMSSDRR